MVRVIIFLILFPFIDHVEWWLCSIEWLFSCVCKQTLDANTNFPNSTKASMSACLGHFPPFQSPWNARNEKWREIIQKSLKVSLTALSHICECFMSREKHRRGRQSFRSEKWGCFSLVASVLAALLGQKKLPHTDHHEYITPGELGRLHKKRSF